MRYGTDTQLSPEEVLARARAFFGAGGELGLPEARGGPGSVTFEGGGGGVAVSARAAAGRTEVTVLSREYDWWAERFLLELR